MPSADPLLSVLKAALAEELRDVRRLIEQIADILVSDERLAALYLEQLQSFDLIIQRAEESAALLDRIAGGTHPVEAVEGVRLSLLEDRLRAALKAA
jgi:hypothetical protein